MVETRNSRQSGVSDIVGYRRLAAADEDRIRTAILDG
jgi:hypothetical protein